MPVLVIRVSDKDTWGEIVMRVAAAKAVACRSIVSAPEGVHAENLLRLHDMTESWAADIEFVEQTTEELIDAVEWGGVGEYCRGAKGCSRRAGVERLKDC